MKSVTTQLAHGADIDSEVKASVPIASKVLLSLISSFTFIIEMRNLIHLWKYGIPLADEEGKCRRAKFMRKES